MSAHPDNTGPNRCSSWAYAERRSGGQWREPESGPPDPRSYATRKAEFYARNKALVATLPQKFHLGNIPTPSIPCGYFSTPTNPSTS